MNSTKNVLLHKCETHLKCSSDEIGYQNILRRVTSPYAIGFEMKCLLKLTALYYRIIYIVCGYRVFCNVLWERLKGNV